MCFGGGHSCKCGMGGGGASHQTEDFALATNTGGSLDRPSLDDRMRSIAEFDYDAYLPEDLAANRPRRALVVRELQRYFELATLGFHFELSAPDCDRVWHEMILHTPVYIEFCKKAFGYYLHHVPGRFLENEKADDVSFCNAYSRRFGALPPREVWSALAST